MKKQRLREGHGPHPSSFSEVVEQGLAARHLHQAWGPFYLDDALLKVGFAHWFSPLGPWKGNVLNENGQCGFKDSKAESSPSLLSWDQGVGWENPGVWLHVSNSDLSPRFSSSASNHEVRYEKYAGLGGQSPKEQSEKVSRGFVPGASLPVHSYTSQRRVSGTSWTQAESIRSWTWRHFSLP